MELKTIDRFLRSDLLKEFKAAHNIASKELASIIDKAATLQTMTNLKLYDIAYKFELDHNFNWFCDQEYQIFSEFLKENDLDALHIGRTSSFYIVPARLNETFEDMDYNYMYGIPESLDHTDAIDFVSWHYENIKDYNDIGTESIIEMLKEMIVDEIDMLEYFMNFTISEIKYDVNNVSKGYEYIETFKKHQVESYSDFLSYESEYL